MPPLPRERREDSPLLASYFSAEFSRRAKRRAVRVSAEARSYLMSYDRPGTSTHENGIAIDLADADRWIAVLGRHGWRHRGRPAPLHFT